MLKASYRGEHRIPRLVCLLLPDTEKCSENGWDKLEKSEQKRSKDENKEEEKRISPG